MGRQHLLSVPERMGMKKFGSYVDGKLRTIRINRDALVHNRRFGTKYPTVVVQTGFLQEEYHSVSYSGYCVVRPLANGQVVIETDGDIDTFIDPSSTDGSFLKRPPQVSNWRRFRVWAAEGILSVMRATPIVSCLVGH